MARARRLKLLVATSVVAGLLCAMPSTSQAGVLVTSAHGCPATPYEQPFLRWGDTARYVAVPGGSFENGAPEWALSKAAVVSGNETFYVRAASDSHSLSIASGGSARSATACVGLDKPTLRFFARSAGTGLLSSLAVNVRFETSLGLVASLRIGSVSPSGSWKATPAYLMLVNLLPLLPGQQTPVQFEFRPVGSGTWWIDDVYVDPKRR